MKKKIVLKNRLSEMQRLFAAAQEFSRENNLPQGVLGELQLCLEEVVSNIIKYGYKDSRTRDIKVEMELEKKRLSLKITDDAAEFNPLLYPLSDITRPIEERAAGGMGIHIIRKLMGRLEYKRQGKRNILFLSKELSEPR